MIRYVAIALVSLVGAAHAGDSDGARELAASDTFTPGILRATDSGSGNGFVRAATELNRATSAVRVSALGEVNVYGPIRAAVSVQDAFGDKPRPGIGVGVRWLSGVVKSTAYLFVKTEGFTEPEGEIESVVAFEHAFGPVNANLNLAYGQDPGGRERDGELAVVAHVEPATGVFVGGTARYRDALGSQKEAIVRDGFMGATSTLAIDRFAVTVMAGIAMVQTRTVARDYGPAATIAVGAMF